MNALPALSVELRALSRLALPMILTQLAQMGMGVVDTLMAGRVSAEDLAGVALGGQLFWPLLLFVSGIVMALTPKVSQLNGAGRMSETGAVVRQALWIALIGGVLLVVFLHHTEGIFRFIGIDARAIPIAVDYLAAMSWGVLPVLGYFALRYLCEGLSWTLPAMLIAASALLLKIPLNLLFIHGSPSLGIPAMGGVGCGWASSIVMTFELIAIVAVVRFSRMRASGVFARFDLPDAGELWRLIRLGLPIGATTLLEFGLFSCVTLLVGRLGVEAVAAHQIASNVGALTFMVPLAIGMAASVRVGHNVGEENFPAARRSGLTAVGVAIGFGVLSAALVLLIRHDVASLYTHEQDVMLMATNLMLFVVLYQIFDNAQVSIIGSLRGYKDTRTPLWVAFVSYWIVGLPVGVVAGFGLLGAPAWGVYGFWLGLSVGLVVAAGLLWLRFRSLSHAPERIRQLATG